MEALHHTQALSSSLVLHGEAVPQATFEERVEESGYSDYEKNILKAMDDLPSHILAKPLNAWQKWLQQEESPVQVGCVFVLPLTIGCSMIFVDVPPPLMASGILGVIFTMAATIAWLRHKSPQVSLSPPRVKNRKKYLASFAQKCASPLIKKRLAELYFLADHPLVELKFWENLKTALEKANAFQTVQTTDEKMLELKSSL